MNSLIYKLGLSTKLGFQDVFSIDDPDLLAFVPRPAYALLLIFPVSEAYENFRRSEDSSKQEYEGSGSGEPIVWYRQTIGNACGLIGLLHGVSNGVARSHIGKCSWLHACISYEILECAFGLFISLNDRARS
jgi:ubiquitin carboxyl-terminal hydrolase L3